MTWKSMQKALTKNAGLLTKKYVLELVANQMTDMHKQRVSKSEIKSFIKRDIKSFSGKVIFGDFHITKNGTLDFFCGPDTNDDYFSFININDFLKQIFKDFKKSIAIGVFESEMDKTPTKFHSIDLDALSELKYFPTKQEVAVNEVIKLVTKRLEDCGAIYVITDEEE